MKKQTFLYGVVLLFLASVVAKLLGAVYRVPLTWVLGAEGLGLYQLVYPLFSLIIVLSSTGMPTAISKIVAGYVSQNNYAAVKKTFRVSLWALFLLGVIFAGLLAILSPLLARIQGNVNLSLCYLGLVPAVILVGILSAFRGYFQGLKNMTPTAISQVVEQAVKLIVGLLGAYFLVGYGIEYGVLGALIGVSVSELVTVAIMWVVYLKDHKIGYNSAQNDLHSTCIVPVAVVQECSTRAITHNLIVTAVPIVISNAILPLVMFLESVFVIPLLGLSGLGVADATRLWGLNTGVVNSLINMPIVLAQSIAISIVPFVAGESEPGAVSQKYNQSIGLGLAFCTPVLVGFVLLARPMLEILYMGSLTAAEVTLATQMLTACGATIVFGTLLQIQNSMLAGLGRGKTTLTNMIISATVQVGLFVTLTQSPLDIWGSVIASIVFYMLAYFLNYIYIRFRLKFRLKIRDFLPILAGLVLMTLFVGNVLLFTSDIWLILIASILGGAVCYFYGVWVFGGLNKLGLKKLKKRV